MSRICKLQTDVKREFSDFGEHFASPQFVPGSNTIEGQIRNKEILTKTNDNRILYSKNRKLYNQAT